jgi:F0F1-type ATP synthase membrane subunit c/vacuolar-type H+-ATPase subunit K
MEHPTTLRQVIRKRVKFAQILCSMMLFSKVFYIFIAWNILNRKIAPPPISDEAVDILVPILVISGIGLLAGAGAVQRYLFAKNFKASAKDRIDLIMSSFFVYAICAAGMREPVALFGMVLSVHKMDMQWVIYGSLLSVVAMLLGMPRARDVERYYSASELEQPVSESG